MVLMWFLAAACVAQEPQLRVVVETDAGGDPDDGQSFVHRKP